MKELLEKYEKKSPEIVFEWNDPETEACGWVVINSLRNGAAGGGTRMRVGLDKGEVVSLAKTMEIKFTVSGPAIGGAKSGINFDPTDPRKQGVLERWYKAVIPLLKNYYGTGGDLNVDEINEVIPITEGYGLWHPQEGVVNGYFQPKDPQKIKKIGQLRQGVSKVIENPEYTPTYEISKKFTVADLITGYGVAEAVKHYYELWPDNIQNKTAIIQGWGNVGSAAALYLAKYGVKVIGIIDKHGGLIKKEGFSLEEIKHLFATREGNKLKTDDLIPFDEVNRDIWKLGADIFIPAAASRLVSKEQLDQLIDGKIEVISCGANVPFKDEEIFYGSIMEKADKNLALLPDFIANCGMARVFAFLMEREIKLTDSDIFEDTSAIIKKALSNIRKVHPEKTLISSEAYTQALKLLV